MPSPAPPPLPNPLGNGAPPPPPPLPTPPPLPPVLPVDDARVVAVRLVYTSPIPVNVVGGAGGLGGRGLLDNPNGRKLTSVFDKLPKQLGSLFGRGEGAGKAVESALGGLAKGGMGAAAAGLGVAAGVGVLLAGLDAVKSTFVDPFISAAKGGFDQGVAKGGGAGVLGKSFEVLGTTIGVVLLPATVRLAVAALTVAKAFERAADSPLGKQFLGGGGPRTGIEMASQVFAGGQKDDGIMSSAQRLQARGIGLAERLPFGLGKAYGRYADSTGLRPDIARTKATEKAALEDVLTSLRNSIGVGQAGYHGVADVRQQAQLAALQQDPLEREIKQKLLKALDELPKKMGEVADNTRPAAG